MTLQPIQAKQAGLFGPVSFGAGLALIGLVPIIRGGNRYVALIGLEWLALLVLWLLAMRSLADSSALSKPRDVAPLGVGEWLLVLSPLWAALLFLTPLPITFWAALPGHAIYSSAPGAAWRALSLTPDATAASLLAGIVPVAGFMLARTATAAQLRVLATVWVLLALLQAIWGLLQAGPFKELYFEADSPLGLMGSFANRNHFANFIVMILPLAIFMLWRALPGQRAGRHQSSRWTVAFSSMVLLVLAAAVLASGSRGGAVTALLVTLLTVLRLLSTVSKPLRRWYALGAVLQLVLILSSVGTMGLITHLEANDLGHDASGRWQLAESSWQAALAFWPAGAGPGSFANVYPQFQPPGMRSFIEHAHNDYVELLVEFGALFVLLAAVGAGLITRQLGWLWQQVRAAGGLRDSLQLQMCCGLGVLAMLLHSWVDFNLRIPANAMLVACLLGAFLRRGPPAALTMRHQHQVKVKWPFWRPKAAVTDCL